MVFPRAGENFRHRGRDEMMEFINIHPEVPTLRFWLVLARHRSLLELRNKQRTEEVRILSANLALGKFRNKNLSAVHDRTKVQPISLLRNHGANWFWAQKCFQAR